MKFLKYLTEEYETRITKSFKERSLSVEVFRNPTTKELREMKTIKYIVYGVNKTKFILYVWEAESFAHHYDIIKSDDISGDENKIILAGVGKYTSGKIQNDHAEFEVWPYIKKIDILKLKKFLERYFILDHSFPNYMFPEPIHEKYMPEEYVTRVNFFKFSTEIFSNPTPKELRQLKWIKYIICAINPTKFIIYVWEGESGVHHSNVAEKLLNTGLWHNLVIMGYAGHKNGKLEDRGNWDENVRGIDQEKFEEWLKKYFVKPPKPIKIFEEYETSIRVRNEEVPVFVNPSKKEFTEMGRDVRFIINPVEKKIYCWSAGMALHDSMIKKLKLDSARFITLGQGIGNKDSFSIFNLVNRGKLSKEEYKKLSNDWIKNVFKNITIAEWLHDGWYYGRI
jgi:hypothetical protein